MQPCPPLFYNIPEKNCNVSFLFLKKYKIEINESIKKEQTFGLLLNKIVADKLISTLVNV